MIPEGNHPEEEGGGGQRGKERSSHRRKLRRVRCLIRAYWTFLWNKIWPDVGGGPAQVKKYLWERREGPSNPSSPSSWFSCGRLARLVISSLNQSCRGPKGIIFIGKPIPRRSVKGLQLVYTGYLAHLDHFLPGRFFNDRSCIVHETSSFILMHFLISRFIMIDSDCIWYWLSIYEKLALKDGKCKNYGIYHYIWE